MELKTLVEADRAFAQSVDHHMDDAAFRNSALTQTGYILWEGSERIGLMTYCVLWNRLPFLNCIFVLEARRGRGCGSQAILLWEQEMKRRGYPMSLLSTQADESAQHLYRRLGYTDCGGLLFDHTPLDQPMEIFFRKVL